MKVEELRKKLDESGFDRMQVNSIGEDVDRETINSLMELGNTGEFWTLIYWRCADGHDAWSGNANREGKLIFEGLRYGKPILCEECEEEHGPAFGDWSPEYDPDSWSQRVYLCRTTPHPRVHSPQKVVAEFAEKILSLGKDDLKELARMCDDRLRSLEEGD